MRSFRFGTDFERTAVTVARTIWCCSSLERRRTRCSCDCPPSSNFERRKLAGCTLLLLIVDLINELSGLKSL
jgi:hypothetical protein